MRPNLRKTLPVLFTMLAIGAVAATPASALPLLMDYTGFSWSSDQAGETTFQAVGVVDGFLPGAPEPDEVYTYYLSDLVLDDQIDLGGGYFRRTYSGGSFAIYESTGGGDRGYDYGIAPPDGSAPASFVDGTFWLGGSFGSFTMLVDQYHGLASFSGSGAYDGGAFYDDLEHSSFFTFAGMTRSNGSGIPYGYEYRIDGQLDAAVRPVPEPASLLLLTGGLVGAGVVHRRRRQA
ncbi:MAG: PEP-CTERM sorting domain-containing protein [Candidatus Eisenbacteria bacterium]|nr:PEP-CTERM sorting domain-containing protein [Candidatus Latescibacterota bacterium]MBD3303425.1 PEP-CTERM sorting domain-containing protein [Candidatus Eisenbacteria bacterium]